MKKLLLALSTITALTASPARADFPSIHYNCTAGAPERTIDYWYTDTGDVARLGGEKGVFLRDRRQVSTFVSPAGRFVVVSPDATKSLSILLPPVTLKEKQIVYFRV